MSLQQFCVRWNNHLKIFQSALPRYFQNQKFLDCTLVAEGQHFISCHRMVLDACSDYFATFLKNKMFDDRNLVICLPKEIKLWQIQAILQFMYHGEVCISQEGLPSLVKCAELLQVKGLCGGDRNTSSEIVKNQNSQDDQNGNSGIKNKRSRIDFDETMAGASQSQPNNDLDYTIPAIEIDENESESEYNGQIIKKEIDICDVMEDSDDGNGSNYANQNKDYSQTNKDENDDQNQHRENNNYDINQQHSDGSKNFDACKLGLIRVKNNLFDNSDNNHTTLNDSGILDFEDMRDDDDDGAGDIITIKNNDDDDDDYSNNSLIYNRNSMDVYVKRKNQQDGDANQTTSNLNLSHIKNSPTSSSSLSNNNNQFENIVCAPNLLQYMSDSENNENDLKIDDSKCVQETGGEVTTYYMPKKLQLSGNGDGGNLFDLMRQKFATCDETSFIPVDTKTTLIKKNSNSGDTNESHFVIASVSSLNKVSTVNKKTKVEQENEAKMFQNLQKLCGDEKASIGGLYLRNPRGNQVRQYDVNALYNALQDVKNGHSIYRAAQTYCVPRKTLRNWMKRLHIKSAYPMPRQLQAAAERKKIMQQQTTTFTSSGSLGELMVVSPNVQVGDKVMTSVSNASIP